VSDAVIATAARAAAAELAGELGRPTLEVDVEVALYALARNPGEDARPARFADPVAVAGLILALAQFAYQAYTDQRKKHRRKPSRESVTREVRIRQWENDEIPRSRQRILDVVIREVIEAAEEEDDDE
jgi:uncharacterized membrane protein YebE (DUF533 family)